MRYIFLALLGWFSWHCYSLEPQADPDTEQKSLNKRNQSVNFEDQQEDMSIEQFVLLKANVYRADESPFETNTQDTKLISSPVVIFKNQSEIVVNFENGALRMNAEVVSNDSFHGLSATLNFKQTINQETYQENVSIRWKFGEPAVVASRIRGQFVNVIFHASEYASLDEAKANVDSPIDATAESDYHLILKSGG